MCPADSKEYHSTPEWLTADYMEQVLRKYYQDDKLKLKKIDVRPATAKGENYASVMTRISSTFASERLRDEDITESFLLKTTFESDDIASKTMKAHEVAKREVYMYEIVLPSVTDLLSNIGDGDKLFARTVHVDQQHLGFILEDLSKQNFIMTDRIGCLDEAHIQLNLKKLAKFHAATAVLNERNPEMFAKHFSKGFCSRHISVSFEHMIGAMLSSLIKYVSEHNHLSPLYREKLLKLKKRAMEYGKLSYDVDREQFMCLVHGDFWTNNMMFKYILEPNAEKSVYDVKFIDFQFSTWTSPTIDLHYFFNTSLKDELRFSKQAEYIKFYYEHLRDTLQQLKFKGHIPSLFEIRMQFEKRQFFGLIAAFAFQPIMLCDSCDDASFNNLVSDEAAGVRFRDSMFNNGRMQKLLNRLLPMFDNLGLLDEMY